MALEDLLGRTSEVRILDFLSTNYGNSYNQSEISEFTGISRNVLYKKLPEMVDKQLLEVDNSIGRFKSYRLANNSIVNKLVALDIEYNLMVSGAPDNKSQVEDGELERPDAQMENRYYSAPADASDFRSDDMIPVTIEIGETSDRAGQMFLSRPAANKLYRTLKDALNKLDAA